MLDMMVSENSAERGKCFIEYLPAENAWNPIAADGYMYIDASSLLLHNEK